MARSTLERAPVAARKLHMSFSKADSDEKEYVEKEAQKHHDALEPPPSQPDTRFPLIGIEQYSSSVRYLITQLNCRSHHLDDPNRSTLCQNIEHICQRKTSIPENSACAFCTLKFASATQNFKATSATYLSWEVSLFRLSYCISPTIIMLRVLNKY
ncbi:hypothetical protein E4U53_005560 [Claviceps sorghi]|nr:hypothetical protein E4U53_005560 [Claviceps sorghi]